MKRRDSQADGMSAIRKAEHSRQARNGIHLDRCAIARRLWSAQPRATTRALTGMTRRITRTPVRLHPERTQRLPMPDVEAILRGADELIASGGRTLLVKVLRGSRDKSVLKWKLDKSPVYGYFRGLSNEEVLAKIDWLISHHLLRYEYDGRLPLLVYTETGWEIERVTYANELFTKIAEAVKREDSDFDMSFLKDKNREVITLLLHILELSGDARYIPLLKSWEKLDYKKVRQGIRRVISGLRDRKTIPT